ncbi:MAG TPA: GNAT family N-acetyltransferase [Clostridiaceae bacterium]|nr:GNAT family N-acetyltransferase [Clostridiaceae bacterium]
MIRWYNNTDDYKYATGIDHGVSLEYIVHSYKKSVACEHEFFAGIYLKNGCEMMGMLKGNLKKENKTVWISQFLIDKIYQRKGYGSQAIEGVLDYFALNAGISYAYVAVAEKNMAGKCFWKKRGFQEFQKCRGHFKDSGEGLDAIVMHKNLAINR